MKIASTKYELKLCVTKKSDLLLKNTIMPERGKKEKKKNNYSDKRINYNTNFSSLPALIHWHQVI